MTNRTDFEVLADELRDMFNLSMTARKRIATELHNAFVAGQESAPTPISPEMKNMTNHEAEASLRIDLLQARSELSEARDRIAELQKIEMLAIFVCEARAEGLPYESRLDKLHEALLTSTLDGSRPVVGERGPGADSRSR